MKCPKLLVMKDGKDNRSDISIQAYYVSLRSRHRPLIIVNYSLRGKWKPEDITVVLFTKSNLRALHHTAEDVSVKKLELILGSANEPALDMKRVRRIENVRHDWNVCTNLGSILRRIMLTLRSKQPGFIFRVLFDTITLRDHHVIHMIEKGRHCCCCLFTMQTVNKDNSEIHTQSVVPPLPLLALRLLITDERSAYKSRVIKRSV